MALDFFAGCLGGCAGVVVGHPLDTVKVLLQTQNPKNPQFTGTVDCLRKIVAREGLKGAYKGMTSPLVGVAAINAIIFGVYGNTQRNLPNPDSLTSHLLAGSCAGLCQSFFCSPMELAKSQAQVSDRTPSDCLKAILKTEGLRGVFRGLGVTIAREIPAFGSYFWTYEYLTRREGPVSTGAMLFAGGTAGAVSWVIVYPVDVIKSRLQIDGGANPQYKDALDCFRKSVQAEGCACLYRGLTPTILRAFPVNAATFAVVTWTMRLLTETQSKSGNGESLWGRYTDALFSLKVSEAPV